MIGLLEPVIVGCVKMWIFSLPRVALIGAIVAAVFGFDLMSLIEGDLVGAT